MDPKIAQLSDIVADWCAADLERIGHSRPVNVDAIAQEMVRCMLFTLAHDPTARDLFTDLLVDELAEIRARFSE